jgi:hypothetical protein
MMCILCCLHHGERKWRRTREAQTEQRLTPVVCAGQTTGLQARGWGNSASLTRIRLLRLKPWQRLPPTCVSDSSYNTSSLCFQALHLGDPSGYVGEEQQCVPKWCLPWLWKGRHCEDDTRSKNPRNSAASPMNEEDEMREVGRRVYIWAPNPNLEF